MKRGTLRIPADLTARLDALRARAEAAAGCALSEQQHALALLTRAIEAAEVEAQAGAPRQVRKPRSP